MAPRGDARVMSNDLGVRRAREIIKKIDDSGKINRDPLFGCWTATIAKNQHHYCYVKRLTNNEIAQTATLAPGEPFFAGHIYYTHRVAYYANCGADPPTGTQVSHLCNNRQCCRPDHILVETAAQNLNRVRCFGPGILDNRGHLLSFDAAAKACQHQPPCFPRREYAVTCPHPPGTATPWSTANTTSLTVRQWLANVEAVRPSAAPPAAVVQASQAGLYSDDVTDEEAAGQVIPDEDAVAGGGVPSSPARSPASIGPTTPQQTHASLRRPRENSSSPLQRPLPPQPRSPQPGFGPPFSWSGTGTPHPSASSSSISGAPTQPPMPPAAPSEQDSDYRPSSPRQSASDPRSSPRTRGAQPARSSPLGQPPRQRPRLEPVEDSESADNLSSDPPARGASFQRRPSRGGPSRGRPSGRPSGRRP